MLHMLHTSAHARHPETHEWLTIRIDAPNAGAETDATRKPHLSRGSEFHEAIIRLTHAFAAPEGGVFKVSIFSNGYARHGTQQLNAVPPPLFS